MTAIADSMNDLLDKRRLPRVRIIRGNLESYEIVDTLQDSLYGRVYQGLGLSSRRLVAIKMLSKRDIKTQEQNMSLPETPLAEVFFADEMANHEYLATIRDVFETEDYHYIISELADGEDLLELLKSNKNGLSEDKARICMRQAAMALSECHKRGFALQDFSLENCLLYSVRGKKSNDENESENKSGALTLEQMDFSGTADKSIKRQFQVKVCDPGQAIRFGRYDNEVEIPVPHLGCVGKRFRPPEIFSGRPYIASKVDSWCLGWSTFYLLFGRVLFESVYALDDDVRWRWYSMGYRDHLYSYLGVKDRLSKDARSFIESLVHPDPICRMSVKDALNHPFLRDVREGEHLVLENWGRPSFFVDTGLGGGSSSRSGSPARCLAGEVKDRKVPFIPDVYKTKYSGMYCTSDKPSGYFPANAGHVGGEGRELNVSKLVMVQNQSPAANNGSMPVTARYYQSRPLGGNVKGLLGSSAPGGIFQKRRSGAGTGATKRTRGRAAITTAIAAAVGVAVGAVVEAAGATTDAEESFSEDGEGSMAEAARRAGVGVVGRVDSRAVPVSSSGYQVGGLSAGFGVVGVGYRSGVSQQLRYHQQQQRNSNNVHFNGYYGYRGYNASCFCPGMMGAYNSRYLVSPAAAGVNGSGGNVEDIQRLVLETAVPRDGLDLTRAKAGEVSASGARDKESGVGTYADAGSKVQTRTGGGVLIDFNNGIGRVPEALARDEDPQRMCQSGGLQSVGSVGYSSSYVPPPTTGGFRGVGQQHYVAGQGIRNFSYVPPALTSRHHQEGRAGVGCGVSVGSGQFFQTVRGGMGVGSRRNYGPLSYVPPPMGL